MGLKLPKSVEIVEVGPRDGLQNEARIKLLPVRDFLSVRFNFVCGLADAGIRDVEAGAFVRPDLVPQMANTGELLRRIQRERDDLWKKHRFWVLVPNLRGLQDAIAAGAKDIAVFTATSEAFNQKNIRMSVKDSLKEIEKISFEAKKNKLNIRAYVSTVWGCPYQGKVSPEAAVKMAKQLRAFGAEEISLGDTIGVATPNQVTELLKKFPKKFPLAMHFHDTRGTALANAMAALEMGITRLDSSAGGLGGCPYAPGASGNLATQDLLYLLNGLRIKTRVDMEKLCTSSELLARSLELPPLPSRFHRAWLGQKSKH